MKTEEELIKEAYDEIDRLEKEEAAYNKKLLSDLQIPDKDFADLIFHCSTIGRLEIVTKPTGENQDEYIGVFKQVYVEQGSVGDSGDSFAGFIYGKLGKRKWLKVPYEC